MKFEQLRQSSKQHLARMAVFYLSVVAFLFMWVMIFGEGLTRVFTVWFDPSLVDSHVVHNVTFFSFIWVFGLAMLVQLYRPANRVTAMQMALLVPIVALIDDHSPPFRYLFDMNIFLTAFSSLVSWNEG